MISLSAVSLLLSNNILLVVAVLLFAAIMVVKAGSRLGAPFLLLFLVLGLLAGPDVLGFDFTHHAKAEHIGHLALTIIIFEAGLETSLKATKPVMKQGLLLSTVGVLLMVLLVGGFVWFALGKTLGLSVASCFLLAAIISSTDSGSVFSVFREKRLKLRENLAPMLELESGSNDPIAFGVTIITLDIMTRGFHFGYSDMPTIVTGILLFMIQMLVGLTIGIAVGYVSQGVLSRVRFSSSSLTSILILSFGFLSSGLATLFYGNGLLAIYVTAIIIGSKAKIQDRKEVTNFFDGAAWLMQLVMFLLLGLMARPSQILPILLPGLLIAAFMMFFARPASVMLTLLPFKKLSLRAKAFVSWVGVKGAGPILCALMPMVAGMKDGTLLFNLVFIITLASLFVQGGTMIPAAKLLRVSYEDDKQVETFGLDLPEEMGMLRDHTVTEEDLMNGATLRDLHLPHGIRVTMVRRDGRFLVPHGSMELKPNDHLLIIVGESDD
ncbi:MAG: potassium/proton antiporter [Bacteroidales bacterium]|nr:potassium/proton antiporter [Bacteroidales bacterium]